MVGIEMLADDQPEGVNHVVELIVGSRGGSGCLGLGKVQAVGEHAMGGGDETQAIDGLDLIRA